MLHRSPRAKQELPAGTSQMFECFFVTKAEMRSNRIIRITIEKLEPVEPFRIWAMGQMMSKHFASSFISLPILFNCLEPHQFHSNRLPLLPMSLSVLCNCCLLGFVLQVFTSQSNRSCSRKEDDILPAARTRTLWNPPGCTIGSPERFATKSRWSERMRSDALRHFLTNLVSILLICFVSPLMDPATPKSSPRLISLFVLILRPVMTYDVRILLNAIHPCSPLFIPFRNVWSRSILLPLHFSCTSAVC